MLPRETFSSYISNLRRSDSEKQAGHGWGEQDGNAEWADEKAGQDIATAEVKDEPGFTPDTGAADPAFTNGPGNEGEAVDADAVAEPEDKTKSYDQYMAELTEKRLALGGGALPEARKPNEGSKQKFPEGKAFSRDPGGENFFVGSGGKQRKAKELQDKKEHLVLGGQYYAPPESGDRGGRGGRGGRGRGEGGGRGRGEFRGGEGRGRGGGEGRGRGRGDFRGGFRGDRDGGPRGDREAGGPRGGRGGGSTFNPTDESAFPALGGRA